MKKPIGHALPDYNITEPSCNDTLPCPYCEGEGKTYDEDGSSTCYTCKGSGELDADHKAFERECTKCEATGYDFELIDDEPFCQVCAGGEE